MKFSRFAAVLVLVLAPFAAHAALTTIGAPWPPIGSTGLTPVLFNVSTNAGGGFVAMGAHAYKNSASLPNNGIDTYYAQPGIYPGEPLKNYANWSFDFAYNTQGCNACQVFLQIDTDPTAGISYAGPYQLNIAPPAGYGTGPTASDSLNMEMAFITLGIPYDFNPFSPSSTAFRLYMMSLNADTRQGEEVASAAITVNVLPEPGTFALGALALAGMAFSRRKA